MIRETDSTDNTPLTLQYITPKVKTLVTLGVLGKSMKSNMDDINHFFPQIMYGELGGYKGPIYDNRAKLNEVINLFYLDINKTLDKLYSTKALKDLVKQQMKLSFNDLSAQDELKGTMSLVNAKLAHKQSYSALLESIQLESENSNALYSQVLMTLENSRDKVLSYDEMLANVTRDIKYLSVIRMALTFISKGYCLVEKPNQKDFIGVKLSTNETKGSKDGSIITENFVKTVMRIYHQDPNVFINRVKIILLTLLKAKDTLSQDFEGPDIFIGILEPSVLYLEKHIKQGVLTGNLPVQIKLDSLSKIEKVTLLYNNKNIVKISQNPNLIKELESRSASKSIMTNSSEEEVKDEVNMKIETKGEAKEEVNVDLNDTKLGLENEEVDLKEGMQVIQDESKKISDASDAIQVLLNRINEIFKYAKEFSESAEKNEQDLKKVIISDPDSLKQSINDIQSTVNFISDMFLEINEVDNAMLKEVIQSIGSVFNTLGQLYKTIKDCNIQDKKVAIEIKLSFSKMYQLFAKTKDIALESRFEYSDPETDINLEKLTLSEKIAVAGLIIWGHSLSEVSELVPSFAELLEYTEEKRKSFQEIIQTKSEEFGISQAEQSLYDSSAELLSTGAIFKDDGIISKLAGVSGFVFE